MTWKGFQSIISIRSSSSNIPTLLTFRKETLDYLKRILNILKNYFSIIGKKSQVKMKYLHINYNDYLTNKNPNSFFLSLTDKKETKLILCSLYITKSTGP